MFARGGGDAQADGIVGEEVVAQAEKEDEARTRFWCRRHARESKSEIRNPKSETNPKSKQAMLETRSPRGEKGKLHTPKTFRLGPLR